MNYTFLSSCSIWDFFLRKSLMILSSSWIISNSLDLFLNFSSSSLIFSVYWASCEDNQWEMLSRQGREYKSDLISSFFKNNSWLEKLCLLLKMNLLSIIYYILSFINEINASVQINVHKEETFSYTNIYICIYKIIYHYLWLAYSCCIDGMFLKN